MNSRTLNRLVLVWLFIIVTAFSATVDAQTATRNEIQIPDIPGYLTLKCDFHIHTVFSDGNVWPPIRPQEAWTEGLDAIAITDHIEYQPHEDDIPTNFNRSHELAKPFGDAVSLPVIRGAEITRDEPPGHLNAIFLQDINPLDTENYMDAVRAAVEQGGLVFWNHPGWKQPNRKSVWYDTQEAMSQEGLLQGIEVVNGSTYYPNAHQWCLDKGLTMFGDSDIHNPIGMNYDFAAGEHRTMTLVFARDRSPEAIKQALQNQRTAIYWRNTLIGEEKYLRPIFDRSVTLRSTTVTLEGTDRSYVQITNHSDVPFELAAGGTVENIRAPSNVTLQAGKTVIMALSATSENLSGKRKVSLPFEVTNLLIAPNKGLPVPIDLNVRFVPEN